MRKILLIPLLILVVFGLTACVTTQSSSGYSYSGDTLTVKLSENPPPGIPGPYPSTSRTY